MSEHPFQSQRYNSLINGMPASDVGFNKKMPYDNSQFQKMNLPSNGISTSSSQSSRDSSPLPSNKQHLELTGNVLTQIPASQLPPSRHSNKSTKNILLSQPQDSIPQNILLASTFNSELPSLITSSPQLANQKVHLVGAMPPKANQTHPPSTNTSVPKSNTPVSRLLDHSTSYSGQFFSPIKPDEYTSQPLSAVSDDSSNGNDTQQIQEKSNHNFASQTSPNSNISTTAVPTISEQHFKSYSESHQNLDNIQKHPKSEELNTNVTPSNDTSTNTNKFFEQSHTDVSNNSNSLVLNKPVNDFMNNISHSQNQENKINDGTPTKTFNMSHLTMNNQEQFSSSSFTSPKISQPEIKPSQPPASQQHQPTPSSQFTMQSSPFHNQFVQPVSNSNSQLIPTRLLASTSQAPTISPSAQTQQVPSNQQNPPNMRPYFQNPNVQSLSTAAPPSQPMPGNTNQMPDPNINRLASSVSHPPISINKPVYNLSPLTNTPTSQSKQSLSPMQTMPTPPTSQNYQLSANSSINSLNQAQFSTPSPMKTQYTNQTISYQHVPSSTMSQTNQKSAFQPPYQQSQQPPSFHQNQPIPTPTVYRQTHPVTYPPPRSTSQQNQANYQNQPLPPSSISNIQSHQQNQFAPPMQMSSQQKPVQQQPHPPGMHQQPYMSQPPHMTQQPPVSQYQQNNYQNLNQQFGNLNVTQAGFNRLWGAENFDLLQIRNILPLEKIEAPPIRLQPEVLDGTNCHPDIFRCTMTKIPESNSLLNKCRLPLGVLIHPFRDLNHLPVIQCSTIVRCRACRTYINPFVYFVDSKRWKCNLCYRVNELPEEFQYDPVSKSFGDPSRRPEIKSSTIEYIAPSEYMLRPPQPAVYLFLLDVSSLATETGYLKILCDILTEELDNLPGDARTQIGFLCYNSVLHFYSIGEGLSQPHEMTVVDIDDVFLPSPDSLLVNLKERKELVKDLLAQLPTRFMNTHDNNSALGAALQVAFKMMSPTGGRVSVFQCSLPTVGPGNLTSREVPANRSNADVQHLNPATDFYKRLALDCSAQQVAVDLFILNGQYVDLSTISGISRFSAGCIHHWPLFKANRSLQAQQFENSLRRYLTRKIGYEAVMRIRCTRGLSIHTFHGNFFVRSTDLLSLPNCNPDAGFGMQVAIEESLSDLQTVCFQAALLYTSSKGERRIRVHTLCLPIANTLTDVLNSADQQCIIGLVAKMAVDRSLQSSLSDARDAFINVVVDVLSAYKLSLNQASGVTSSLLAPGSLKLLPLYVVALLKYVAFRIGIPTRLDDRVFAMCQMKSLPLGQLIQEIYPDLYPIHCLTDEGGLQTDDGHIIPQPPRLHLSAEKLESRGAFLLDCGHHMMIYVGHAVSNEFLTNVLGFPHFSAIPDDCFDLPKTGTPDNDKLHVFISSLNDEKPYQATIQIIRDNSPVKKLFLEKLIEDRIETALSYYEFLQHLKTHVK